MTNVARTAGLRSSNVVVRVLPDADADGLADDDRDGLSNWQEYTAGTDPTNALSYLKVASITRAEAGSAAVLNFWAVSNKTYTVQYRESLDAGAWNRLADGVASATNRVVELSDRAAAGGPQRFYRLVTPRAP